MQVKVYTRHLSIFQMLNYITYCVTLWMTILKMVKLLMSDLYNYVQIAKKKEERITLISNSKTMKSIGHRCPCLMQAEIIYMGT